MKSSEEVNDVIDIVECGKNVLKLIGLQKHNLIKTVFLSSSCHVMSF